MNWLRRALYAAAVAALALPYSVVREESKNWLQTSPGWNPPQSITIRKYSGYAFLMERGSLSLATAVQIDIVLFGLSFLPEKPTQWRLLLTRRLQAPACCIAGVLATLGPPARDTLWLNATVTHEPLFGFWVLATIWGALVAIESVRMFRIPSA